MAVKPSWIANQRGNFCLAAGGTLMWAIVLMWGHAAVAKPPSAPAAAPQPTAAERVLGVIRGNRSALPNLPPDVQLAELAADPDWVSPGQPDASEIYNRLVTSKSGPAARDLDIVRDWIANLPRSRPTQCVAGKSQAANALADRVARDLREQLPLRRPKLRYLSLAPLRDRCALAFADADAIIGQVMGRLSPGAIGLMPTRLDPDGAIWRFDLDETTLTSAQWEAYAARFPYATVADSGAEADMRALSASNQPVLRVDWLAAELIGDDPITGPLAGVLAVYREPLDTTSAAAELGLDAAVFRRALWENFATGRGGGEASLLTDLVSRRQFRAWFAALALAVNAGRRTEHRPPEDRAGPARQVSPSLMLVTQSTSLATGELLNYAVRSTQDCSLEIIDVDPAGRATLLYPNDLQRNNRLKAGTTLVLPGPGAGYQLRLDQQGVETIIAECAAPGSRRPRTDGEYVRQRFLDLGEWRRAKASSPPAAASIRPANSKNKPSAAPAVGGLQARAGFVIEVK